MAGVVAAINKGGMTSAEKLKATDTVASAMLAVAKLGVAAMQQTRTRCTNGGAGVALLDG